MIAGDAGFAHFGQVHREPAPAAADVEHAVVALDQELGRQVPLLGDLGVVEGLVGGLEVGAAILAVGVEEQRIELAVEVVVVRDVAARALRRIELPQPAVEVSDQPLQARP